MDGITAQWVRFSFPSSLPPSLPPLVLRHSIQLLGGLMYLYRLHRLMALVTGVGLGVFFVVTGVHLLSLPPSLPPSLLSYKKNHRIHSTLP